MTHEHPPGRKPQTLEESALTSAAFCMTVFATLVWPIGRMWNQTPRDWEMILPAFVLEAFLFVLALASIVRYWVLRKRAGGQPAKAAPAEGLTLNMALSPLAIPYPTLDPFEDGSLAAPDPAVDLELEDTDEPFVYPPVPAELGEAFQRIMATIRELHEDPTILADLDRLYAAAMNRPRFRDAEAFVIAKAERHPAYNANAYREPINALNPALFLDQADSILPLAATIAAMVLVADDLPEEVWDLLAAPWEAAGLPFPQVVLAG
jgi:hypothetical protein